MSTSRCIGILGCLFSLWAGPAFGYEALRGPTELRYWNPDKAYNGYTLFATYYRIYLIDMAGEVVHTWPTANNPRFLDYNGHIMDATNDAPNQLRGFEELDWDGAVVWRHLETRPEYTFHHDFVRIFNQQLGDYTTLYIANKSVAHASAIAAGCDPAHGPYDGAQVDAIVEVDMNGQVVWEWWFFDHGVQDIDPGKPNYVGEGKTIADHPGRINLNLPGKPLSRDWLHCNSLDYNPALGHLVINAFNGEFYVIDHDGTFIPGDVTASLALAAGPAGDFLYRFGDPARYQQGLAPRLLEDWTKSTTGHKQIGASHDVHWIPPGRPGAGHFLIFNNGQHLFEITPQSYVVEVDPYRVSIDAATDHYVNPPDAGYYTLTTPFQGTLKAPKQISNQTVWMYATKSNQAFFSHIGSGAQRLPNGNTLICSMTEGHLFEVTPDGELVWEYICPVSTRGIVKELEDDYPLTNGVFRAYRYAADHPALAGRDLSPKGPITEFYNTPTPTPTATATPPLPGDVHRDGRIDHLDVFDFSTEWQGTEAGSLKADLDGDGQVDADDLLLLIDAVLK